MIKEQAIEIILVDSSNLLKYKIPMKHNLIVSVILLLASASMIVGCGSGGSNSTPEDNIDNDFSDAASLSLDGQCWTEVDSNGKRIPFKSSIKWIQNGESIIGRFYPQSTQCDETSPGINQTAGSITSQIEDFYVELSSPRNYCGGRYYQTYTGSLNQDIFEVQQRYFYTEKNCLGDDSRIFYSKFKRL